MIVRCLVQDVRLVLPCFKEVSTCISSCLRIGILYSKRMYGKYPKFVCIDQKTEETGHNRPFEYNDDMM